MKKSFSQNGRRNIAVVVDLLFLKESLCAITSSLNTYIALESHYHFNRENDRFSTVLMKMLKYIKYHLYHIGHIFCIVFSVVMIKRFFIVENFISQFYRTRNSIFMKCQLLLGV